MESRKIDFCPFLQKVFRVVGKTYLDRSVQNKTWRYTVGKKGFANRKI